MNKEQGRLGQKRYGGIFYEEFLHEQHNTSIIRKILAGLSKQIFSDKMPPT